MKITSSRLEDLERQRDEYDAETKKLTDVQDQEDDRYRTAAREAKAALEKKVSDMIGSTSLDLDIRVEQNWDFDHTHPGWDILIRANENRKWEDTTALVWNWEMKLGRGGEIVKDSGSWSGLKAITPEQMDDLEESVRILKILNTTDWSDVVKAPGVYYEDFHDKELGQSIRDRKNARPKFEDDIFEAKLEDLVGTNTAIKLTEDQYFRGNIWMLVTGVTDKFVKGYIFPQYILSQGRTADDVRAWCNGERRTAKSKIAKNYDDGVTDIITMNIPTEDME